MVLSFMFLIIYLIVFRDSFSNLKNMYWSWIIYLLSLRELKLYVNPGLYTCSQIRTHEKCAQPLPYTAAYWEASPTTWLALN